jgi:hypothetical protein
MPVRRTHTQCEMDEFRRILICMHMRGITHIYKYTDVNVYTDSNTHRRRLHTHIYAHTLAYLCYVVEVEGREVNV